MLEEPLSLGHIEWRLAATTEARRQAAEAARVRRRQRLIAAGVFAVAVIVLLVLAICAYAMPEPYARASFADVDGRLMGSAAVTITRDDNAAVVKTASDEAVASWTHGRAYVESTTADGAIESISAVTLDDVSLFDGRITATRIDLLASASATRAALASGTQGSDVSGLVVDGKPFSLKDLPLTIDGLGTLTALTERTSRAGQAVETRLTGLAVTLSGDWKDLPAGAEVVAGELGVASDIGVARGLVPAAKPTASPNPKPKPKPKPSAAGG
jgi:hypothetical protein